METHLGEQSKTYSSELGEFVSDSHRHFAQLLHDYREGLTLVYIPQKDRDATDTKPWAIEDRNKLLGTHIIRYLSDAEMMEPEKILTWIWEGDLSKHRPVDLLEKFDQEERFRQMLNLKKEEEDLADMADHVHYFLTGGREKLNYIRYDKHTKFVR